MVNKLFKYDFEKNFKSVFLFFALSLGCAFVSRGINELGKNIGFFNILGIFFTSMEYAFLANAVIQPLIRGLTNFGKSMYGDESYLTHTIPATKTQILTAKSLSSLAVMGIGFGVVLVSVFVLAFSKSNMQVLNSFIAMLFGGVSVPTFWVVALIVVILFVEFMTLFAMVECGIVVANHYNNRKVLMGFVWVMIFQLLQTVLGVGLICIAGAITGDISTLFSGSFTMTYSMFVSVCIAGLLAYVIGYFVFFFISRHLLNKGVNVN